jgi:hypothetical protein
LNAKESARAKSRGSQDEDDMTRADIAFYRTLELGKKISKDEAGYKSDGARGSRSCIRCKFNLGDEQRCHLVNGKINNEKGLSKFFSPKGDGMLPGDVVWKHVKKTERKLRYDEGHVIRLGAPGFRCKDCKYYLYSRDCLIVEGKFKPKMSCGFIVRIGHGTAV